MKRIGLFVFVVCFALRSLSADYIITSSSVTQSGYTSSVIQGATDVVILQLIVVVEKASNGGQCNPAVITEINVQTAGNPGTTSFGDIQAVMLWSTGTNSAFTSPVLLGTISSPSNLMTFTLNDSYCTNDNYYYWITYDVSSFAQPGNLLDASIPASGIGVTQSSSNINITPSPSDPSGSRTIICSGTVSAPATPALSPLSISTRSTLAVNSASTGVGIALSSDSTVWGAGSDQDGEMGDSIIGNPNLTDNAWVQVPTAEIKNIIQVDLGFNTVLALRDDGTVWGWGDNWWGKIGFGTAGVGGGPTAQPIPQQAIKEDGSPLTGVVKILTAYNMSVAMTLDHKVFLWGHNTYYLMGPNSYYPSAKLLMDGTDTLDWAMDIGIGDDFISILRWDGTVWSAGNGQFGQLGNGQVYGPGGGSVNFYPALKPGSCDPLSGISSISVSRRWIMALDSNGYVYSWGLNNYGQTGTGSNNNLFAPQQVLGPNCNGFLSAIVQISASGDNGYAIDSVGNLFAWGSDNSGQLGDGSPPDTICHCPKLVETNVEEVQAGISTVLIKKSDGCVYGAGSNDYGNFGGPPTTGVKSFGVSDLFGCGILILPLDLINFRGEKMDDEIALSWETSNEANMAHYIVEKKVQNSFEDFFRVEAKNISKAYYKIVDQNPFQGKNYYRLTGVGDNGNVERSKIITVDLDTQDQVLINVVYDDKPAIHIISNKKGIGNLKIYNLLGQEIYDRQVQIDEFSNKIELPDFGSQLYIVKIRFDGKEIIKKIIF